MPPRFGRADSSQPKGGSIRLHRRRLRAGLTLYEVVLALAIYLVALTALSELIATSSQAAIRAQLQTRAHFLCESKLSDVLTGADPMRSVTSSAVEGHGEQWSWSLQVESTGQAGVLHLTVSVSHEGADGANRFTESLVRLARDPATLMVESDEETGDRDADRGES